MSITVPAIALAAKFMGTLMSKFSRCISCEGRTPKLMSLNTKAHVFKGKVMREIFSSNLSCSYVALQFKIVCCAYYHLYPAKNFHVAKIRSDVCFCFAQHQGCNLQFNIGAGQVDFCYPHYFTLTLISVKLKAQFSRKLRKSFKGDHNIGFLGKSVLVPGSQI